MRLKKVFNTFKMRQPRSRTKDFYPPSPVKHRSRSFKKYKHLFARFQSPPKIEHIKTNEEKDNIDILNDPLRQMKIAFKNPGDWLHKFSSHNVHKQGNCTILIDKKPTLATVDTGATRFLATSKWAQNHFGSDYANKLQQCPISRTNDAQGNSVQINGWIPVTVQLAQFLKVQYALVIYEADIPELLLGYTFLYDAGLAVYPGYGIINAPV